MPPLIKTRVLIVGGGPVGMTLAHAATERGPALDEAFRHDTLAIVERYLPDARDLDDAISS